MASGSQLQAKIAGKLALLNATPRPVKFRLSTRTGGNTRLGIGGTVQTTDTLASPQPAAQLVSVEQLAGTNNKLLQPGDWEFTFAGTLPEDTLQKQQILFGDELLNIVQYEPYALNGIVVAWRVIARTVETR